MEYVSNAIKLDSVIHKSRKITDNERGLIVRKYQNNQGPKQIAEDLNLNPKTVTSIIKVFKDTGRIETKMKRQPKQKKLSEENIKFIKDEIHNDVSITLDVLKSKLVTEKNVNVSRTTINSAINDFNYSFKRIQMIPSARNTEQNKETRFSFCENYLVLNDEKVVCVDKFGISCSSRNKYGRSEVNTTPRKVVRTIRSRNVSVLAAISKRRVISYISQNSSFTRNAFVSFLCNLLNFLSDGMRNATIIMDNCSIHKGSEIADLVQSKGFCLLFTPPYSPQLNAIEEVFSKWKGVIKSANPNTNDELLSALFTGMNKITENDCVGFFNHVRKFAVKGLKREDF